MIVKTKAYLKTIIFVIFACVSHANATLIPEIEGNKGSVLEWSRIDDRTLGYSIDSTNIAEDYIFSQVLIPFLSNADRNLITVDAGQDWSCIKNQNYSVCDHIPSAQNQDIFGGTDTFTALFTLPQEYVFGNLQPHRHISATATANNFELFAALVPEILRYVPNPAPPVFEATAPNGLSALMLFSLSLFGLRFNKSKN